MVDRAISPTRDFSEQQQRHFMEVALNESRHALPACQPNPPVGCVIVRGDEIVARGFTGAPGTPHAEAAALLALGRSTDVNDLAVFVTLEPCAFVGRTPSCARALVLSGIGTVFVGTLDPDPRNNGAGIEIMRSAGIDVRVGILEDLVLAFISPYLGVRPQNLNVDDQFIVTCPYCGEDVEIYVEPDVRGTLVQDCEVCCNPWRIRITGHGDDRDVVVQRADGSE